MGTFSLKTRSGLFAAVTSGVAGENVRVVTGPTEASIASQAARISLPVYPEVAAVIDEKTGLCLEQTERSTGTPARWADCVADSVPQEWLTETIYVGSTEATSLQSEYSSRLYIQVQNGALVQATFNNAEGFSDWAGFVPVDGAPAGVTARVVSVDSPRLQAVITGTGTPGASIALAGPGGGASQVVVAPDGSWSTTVGRLIGGVNTIGVTQTANGTDTTASIDVTVRPTPVGPPSLG